jgi:hypothetical protein
MMFLNQDGYGSVMATPAAEQSARRNQFGSYNIQFLRIYAHFVHVVKVWVPLLFLLGLLRLCLKRTLSMRVALGPRRHLEQKQWHDEDGEDHEGQTRCHPRGS